MIAKHSESRPDSSSTASSVSGASFLSCAAATSRNLAAITGLSVVLKRASHESCSSTVTSGLSAVRVMVASPSSPPQVRCRQIRQSDLDAVADVLARGFPAKPRKYWTSALDRLAERGAPEGCPTFGYLLEADGAVVGVLLLIFAETDGALRCNVSSWYVEPAHRGHAALLAGMASKLKHVTYINTSPETHTWPILDALGYRRYSQGQFAAVPALTLGGEGRVRLLAETDRGLPDYDLLAAHAQAGCLALICETADGPEPFVFLP